MLIDNIRKICKEKHIPIHEVEKYAGYAPKSIYRVGMKTDIRKIFKIAEKLDVSVDELLKE